MKLIAIDPSINALGVAVFNEHGYLLYARTITSQPHIKDPTQRIAAMASQVKAVGEQWPTKRVIEWPQVDKRTANTDPEDLWLLAGVCGALSTETSIAVRPREWKGQLPANVCARRILERLEPIELEAIDGLIGFTKCLDRAEKEGYEISHRLHNAIDAVGLGLYQLGRFSPRKVHNEK